MRKYIVDETSHVRDETSKCIIGHELWCTACPYAEMLNQDEPLPHCVCFEFNRKGYVLQGDVCAHFKGFHVPASTDFLKGVCVKCGM